MTVFVAIPRQTDGHFKVVHSRDCIKKIWAPNLVARFLFVPQRHYCLLSYTMSTDIPPNFEERLRERERLQRNPLSTIPSVDVRIAGNLPNTPLSAATIAFSLGTVFCFGFSILLGGLSGYWWMTYQFGFFVAAWAAFHFGEFAVTAGWNLEKCSVECKWVCV